VWIRLFPDRQSMIKRANALWALLMVVPLVFILVIGSVVVEVGGLGITDMVFFNILLLVFVIVSIVDLVIIVYTQTSRRFLAKRSMLGRTFQRLALGSILAEGITVYGCLLTLLSGSLVYIVAFASASWILLIWVRTRFTANLKNIPDIGPTAA
jgi:hypothetical protein